MDLQREPGEARSPATAEGNTAAGTRRKLLLLVEDNHADVFLIEQAIEFHQVPVELMVAEDGEAALQFLQRVEQDAVSAPALMLLDLNLPKRSGTEVLAQVRASSQLRHLPIVVLTSSDSALDRQAAEQLGANRYFRKPTSYHEFLQIGALLNELLKELT